MIVVETHTLNPKISSQTICNYNTILDYLQHYHKDGFLVAADVFLNQRTINYMSFDEKVYSDDIVVIVHRPAVTAAMVGGSVYAFLINLAISAAVSYAMGEIFKPDLPDDFSTTKVGNRGNASSVYSLNAQRNEAKIGQIIPIIYGKVRTYPALISPPYRRYENNEEYLYHLMCVGQGRYNIDKLMLNDTDVNNIAPDLFSFRTFNYEDFSVQDKIKDTISTEFNDSNYHQLVKTLPDIENLEIRGTPQDTSMVMRFENSTITFYPYANGIEPDLSSLQNGSTIIIANTLYNDGTYIVDSIIANVVTVQSHTFTLEPNIQLTSVDMPLKTAPLQTFVDFRVSKLLSDISSPLLSYAVSQDNFEYGGEDTLYYPVPQLKYNDFIRLSDLSEYSVGQIIGHAEASGNYLFPEPSAITLGLTSIDIIATTASATFSTSYGAYKIKEATETDMYMLEIDYIFPNGLYNVNATTGAFEDRTVEFETAFYYGTDNSPAILPQPTITVTKKDNSPIRVTKQYSLSVFSTAPLYLRIKRITAEPTGNTAMDKLFIQSVKKIYTEPDNSTYGNVTLLWCKMRASNAISSIGQFAVNAWVTRSDVQNDVKSVLEDIYSNIDYGGRLPAADLEIISTGTYGEWKNDSFYYAAFLPTGYYEIQQYTGYVYLSQVIPPVGIPFLGVDGNYYEIEALPTLGVNTAVRTFEPHTINGAYDSKLTIYDAMKLAAKSNRYSLNLIGSKIGLKKDDVAPLRTAHYSETNIIKDSLKISYNFTENNEYDSIKIKYYDNVNFKDAEAIYPTAGIYPHILELWGCTDATLAASTAKYLYKQDKARRKTIEFKTDLQGLLPQFMDRFGVTHNVPLWGLSSVVTSVNGNVITINDNIAVGYDTIIFRNDDGSLSDLLSFTADGTILTVTSLPLWVHSENNYEATKCSIGTSSKIVQDFLVTSIKPNGDSVTIEGINYDANVYI